MLSLLLSQFLFPTCPRTIQEYVKQRFDAVQLDGDKAVWIVQHESGFKANAINKISGDYGYFQFSRHWNPKGANCFGKDSQLDCEIKEAINLVFKSGWNSWTTWKHRKQLK